MRVLRLLLKSALILTIIGVIAFLGAREVLLAMSMAKLREGLSHMRNLRISAGSIANQCQSSALTDPTQATVDQLQLTFTSDTDFQIELICRLSSRQPIVLSTYTLPLGTKKVPGTAGVIWGPGSSGVTIESWGRRRSLILQDQQISYVNGELPPEVGVGPVATCEGFGYMCCSADSTIGEGLQINTVRDCPRSCYSSCATRPVVLSFSTQPFYEAGSRVVQIASGEPVTFNYIVSAGTPGVGQIVLNFGDGSEEVSVETTREVSHVYSCSANACEYPVTLQVTDAKGTPSVDTPINKFIIRVSGS